MRHVNALLILILATACGGSSPSAAEPAGGSSQPNGDDLDVADDGGKAGDGAAATEAPKAAPAPKPPVTFKLVNEAGEDLVLSIDKGWQPVIFAFTGKPPNAKSILMFPTHCTASCDAAAEELCPVCAQPEKVKDVKAAEKREVVAPSGSFEVPWDGQIHVYEKTQGKDGGKKGCDCYRTEAAPAATYTVRACGLRITKSAKSSSKLQCADGTMTLPAEGPQVVELKFPAP